MKIMYLITYMDGGFALCWALWDINNEIDNSSRKENGCT